VVNLFGFQIDGYNLEAFLAATRVLFVVLALGAAVLMVRRPDARTAGRILIGLAIAGHGLAWFATMFPLPNVYGANGSMDRENHLGWANVVALGFSPLRTFQVNHLHFEPVWPLLTALAAGLNVDRVPLVFQWQPFVVGIALLLTVRFAWRRGMAETPDRETEAALAAMGGLLLVAVPDEFGGMFRNPWALMFLLKPNHALGLVLVPLAALAVSRASNWKSRLFAGFMLQLVGWAFVIHMALFVAGLAVFVALSFITRRSDRMRDLLDAGTAVGANLLLVSPYLVMLVVAYPFLKGHAMYSLSPFSDRFLDGTLRLGVLFLLSAFGAWRLYQGGGRFGRILASQWLGAQIVWQAFPILGLFGQAREQDEAFYWCRFWIGVFAGVGLLQALRRVLLPLGLRERLQGVAAAATLLVLLPSLLPAWWDPGRMDHYFRVGRNPIPDWIAAPTHFIRTNTPENAVFASDWNYARWIAAYGARRVLIAKSLNLPNDYKRRMEVESALFRHGSEEFLREGSERYGVEYVLATSNVMAQAPDVTLELLRSRPHLETIYDHESEGERVMIFKVRQVEKR
jgi:hypothetical protein